MGIYRCMGCMREYDDSMKKCPHCSYRIGTAPIEPFYLAPETVLDGRYIVGRALGASASTITYLAWDFVENCKIVIKEYFPVNFASRMPGQCEVNTYDGEKAKQFEAGLRSFIAGNTDLSRISASLGGVAAIKAVFIENSTAYTVIEFVDGVSFDKVLADTIIPWQDIVEIMKPVLSSLDSVHRIGLIHANISPDNIIMTRDKKVKLLSFKNTQTQVGNLKNLDATAKKGFSPLEMYGDDVETSPATDVYSIAAIMYYAITGTVPVSAIERVEKDTLKTPREMGVSIPENVENALMNALNVNVQNRTADCQSFIDELSSSQVIRRAEAKKKTDTGKFSKKSKAFLAICSVVVIAAIVALVLTQSSVIGFKSKADSFPDLSGLTIEEVEKTLKKYDNIIYEVSGTLEDENAEEDTVIWQSIEPKSKLDDDKTVTVKIKIVKKAIVAADADAEEITMPSLIAETAQSAREILATLGLTNYSIEERSTSYYSDGVIFYQSVEKGETVDKDDYIVLHMAKKVEPATAVATTKRNNTENKTTTAKQEKETKKDKNKNKDKNNKKDKVTTTEAPKVTTTKAQKVTTTKAPKVTTTKPAKVTTTKPEKTTKPKAEPTTKKTKPTEPLKGMETTAPTTTKPSVKKVTVPNVVGMDSVSARAALMNVKLNVVTSAVSNTDENGNVIGENGKVKSSSPAAGASVEEGSTVTLYVYQELD